MIYFTAEKLFMKLAEIVAQNPDATVDIATYSMYLQITKDKDYSYHGYTPAREFIERINKNNLRMIVGLPYYMECKPNCLECARGYNQRIDRLEDTARALHINARFHPLTHLKFYRIGDRIFTGGINLTSSDWTDVAVEITDPEAKKELQQIFDATWRNAVQSVDELRKKELPVWTLEKQNKLIVDYPEVLVVHNSLKHYGYQEKVVIESKDLEKIARMVEKAHRNMKKQCTLDLAAHIAIQMIAEANTPKVILDYGKDVLSLANTIYNRTEGLE